MSELITDHVSAILGPTHSSFAAAVYSQFDVAEIPMLGLSLTVPGLTAFSPTFGASQSPTTTPFPHRSRSPQRKPMPRRHT